LSVLTIFTAGWLLAADAPTDAQSRLLNDVKILADDAMEGRGIGTAGLDMAADYIRAEFEKAGLDVTAVNGGAFQKFTMPSSAELGEPNTLQLRGPEGKTIDLTLGVDFTPISIGNAGAFTGGIVFAGYGIAGVSESAARQPPANERAKAVRDYNDFAGLDLKGKAALVIRKTPGQKLEGGSPFMQAGGRGGSLNDKLAMAADAGAAAVILVNDPHSGRQEWDDLKRAQSLAAEKVAALADTLDTTPAGETEKIEETKKGLAEALERYRKSKEAVAAGEPDPLIKFGYGGNEAQRQIPMVQITRKQADELLKATLKKSLADLEKEIDSDLKPRSAALPGWTAAMNVAITRTETELKNVLGVLEGSGPTAHETVVIGAHYDHVGRGGVGSRSPGTNEIHNGADDNASGTASLLELARRFAAMKGQLPRRVVFIAFTAEESGLIGSARYCREPVFPLESTVAMLNLDMVGRLDDGRLIIYGTGTSKVWDPLIDRFAAEIGGFKVSKQPEGFGPSDHSSFYAKKIPVLHFFTGTHEDYHRPGDDWEKINVPGMAAVTDLTEKIALEIIRATERPDYVEVQGRANIGRSGSTPERMPRPYFGSIPDYGVTTPGYALNGVAPGGPADKAGLQGGDIIIGINDDRIESVQDFDAVLRKYRANDTVTIKFVRNKEEKTTPLTLGAPRG
jgi:hypothetical protein